MSEQLPVSNLEDNPEILEIPEEIKQAIDEICSDPDMQERFYEEFGSEIDIKEFFAEEIAQGVDPLEAIMGALEQIGIDGDTFLEERVY